MMTDTQTSTAYRAQPVKGGTLSDWQRGADLVDTFAITLPPEATGNVEDLARFVLASAPAGVSPLMALRDRIMARFGVKTASQIASTGRQRGKGVVGSFPVQARGDNEIVLGEDDKHLDFRLIVRLRKADGARELSLETIVHCHNWLGRTYLAAIAPFHRRIVPAYLDHAARRGWPAPAA